MKRALFLALLLPGIATAAQGEICVAPPGTSNPTGIDPITNETRFTCPTAGTDTLPGLYRKGWRVVTAFPQSTANAANPTFPMQTQWTLIIEKL